MNETSGSGSAETDASGKASCKLDYGDYKVTLGNLPDCNFYDGGKDVSGANPTTSFDLREPSKPVINYRVTVKSEGNLLFKDHRVMVYKNGNAVSSGKTDENGVFTFSAEEGNYTVYSNDIPKGYAYKNGPLELTADTLEGEIVLKSAIITEKPADNTRYVIGDIFHNYTFTTTYEVPQYEYERDAEDNVVRDDNGNAIVAKNLGSEIWSKSVTEILKEKKVLILNNWGTNCSNCIVEMPHMQEVYEEYGDLIELVAVSNYVPYDTDAIVTNYAKNNGLTFPLMLDQNGFTAKFGITGWPTTVVIDRYGAIARIEVGAITSVDAWKRLIEKYIGDDYVQTFTPGDHVSDSINTEISKPDITVDDDHYEKLGEAINNKESLASASASVVWSTGETQYEYAWPFLVKQPEDIEAGEIQSDIPYMYASNTGKPNSMAVICAKVTVPAGKVFTFDYYISSEAGYDSFFVYWDGRIIYGASGEAGEWKTCHAYVDLADGTHDLIFVYRKDDSNDEGIDNVYIRNVHFEGASDITESTDMLRSAAYGDISNGRFAHYASVALDENDKNGFGSKYYHVDFDSLENNTYAGNDKNPLLFVNLRSATPWSPYSINDLVLARNLEAKEGEDEYLYSFVFTIKGVTRDYRNDFIKYLSAASSSYVPNCVPVDEFLHDMLVAFMQEVTEKNKIEWHEDKWLEACYFYSHYGSGDPVGNPILGVMEETAITIGLGKHTADLTRNMAPFPVVTYAFTSEADGVYKFESLIENAQYGAQIWIYRDSENIDKPLVYDGDYRIHRDGTNEQNFVVYYYMKANQKYYVAVAFMNQESGTYDFEITDMEIDSYTELTPASLDFYSMILDEKGEWSGGEVELAGAIEYETKRETKYGKEDDYYYAKNGSPIYIDVENVTTGLITVPISKLLELDVPYPPTFEVTDDYVPYGFFDFRYCSIYWEEGNNLYVAPSCDISEIDPSYKNYTEILKGYVNNAEDGLVHVNQEIVDILTLFFELRVHTVYLVTQNDGSRAISIEAPLENEWLRFCWYNKIHSAQYESLDVND